VLGFVVGLALSFRSSTAYERYNEGRKYWAQLLLHSQNLARLIWVHAEERQSDPALAKEDLLGKITFLNLISAFAVALKHKLRFEPHANYPDLQHLVAHLDTFAAAAKTPEAPRKPNPIKTAGKFLGLPMAESNPRKLLKKSDVPLGNLPLEVLTHMSSFMKHIFSNDTFKAPIYQTQALNSLTTLNDILTGTDRILSTPLPIAYSIAIGQITWVYILLLPFQLYKSLGWVTIPASVFAAYIILGIALIGREIENPFGDDVNDLPLDAFCSQIRKDVEIILSKPAPKWNQVVANEANELLWPLTEMGMKGWADKSVEQIREALEAKPKTHQHSDYEPRPSTATGSIRRRTEAHRAEEGGAGPKPAPASAPAGGNGPE
jgi:putative membrane protein